MENSRQLYLKRMEALKSERSTWIDHWRELAMYISPRRFRYLLTDRNKGWKQNQFIINNTATRGLRTLAAGMMAGITSPARQWFKLTLQDKDRAEFGAVRSWLDQTERVLLDTYSKSNIYNCFHSVYENLAGFGTAPMHVEDDWKDGIRGYVLPIGQFVLANSSRLQVDSVYREFSMTVVQMVQAFGLESCSARVQSDYKAGNYESWVEVVHVVEPNRKAEYGKLGQKQFPWKSCWMEKASELSDGKYLRESGFQEFSVMAPRWVVTGEDVYGGCPGMDALGDIKALQQLERRKAQALDKIVNPPMKAPSALMNQRVSTLPGDTIYVDTNIPGQTVEPAITINANAIQAAEASIREHEQRINGTFYSDLWLMMAQSDTNMTAREVAERHEEKMLQLGPVMERLENELFDPFISRTLGILGRTGKLPPPPQELRGQELTVDYISIMAQAQKLLRTTGIERLVSFVGGIVGVKPDIIDKVDLDAAVEDMADSLGVQANLIVPQEQVDATRTARAKEQKQMNDIQKAQALAQGAATLSKTDVTGDNALTRIAGSLPQAAQAGLINSGGG
jgi:hypothetical protein